MNDFVIPRCDHDCIILACPDPSCEKQNAYLADQDEAFRRWHEQMVKNAQAIFAQALLEASGQET